MNEHMKISEETIKEMKRTVKEVIRTLGMEINSGRMEAHEKEFIYGLELRTGYGWRILRTRVTLEANGKTRIWATSYRPAPIGSREESEDDDIEIVCKDPIKGIADAVRYVLVDGDEEDPGGEGEDEEPDGRPDGAQEGCSEALGQDRRTDEGTPRTCMRMHEGGDNRTPLGAIGG